MKINPTFAIFYSISASARPRSLFQLDFEPDNSKVQKLQGVEKDVNFINFFSVIAFPVSFRIWIIQVNVEFYSLPTGFYFDKFALIFQKLRPL